MLWLFFGDVFLLTGVSFDVVEFLAVDEAVLVGHDGGLSPFDGIDDTLGIGDEEAVGPLDIRVRIEEVVERGAIEFDIAFVGDFADVEEGGDEIDGVGEGVDLAMLVESGSGPVDEHGDAVSSVVFGAFSASHASVENIAAGGGSVVGGEDEDGVVCDAEFGDELAGGSDVLVDVGDHAEEGGDAVLSGPCRDRDTSVGSGAGRVGR